MNGYPSEHHRGRHDRVVDLGRAAKLGIVGFCLLFLAYAGAQAQVTMSHFPPNPGVLPGGGWEFSNNTTFGDPPPQRAWTNGVYGTPPKGGLRVADPVTINGRAGPLAVTVGRSAGWAAIGGAVGRCLAMANPACAIGSAAYTIYSAYRVTPDGAGGLLWDPGIEEEQVPSYYCQAREGDAASGRSGPSLDQACAASAGAAAWQRNVTTNGVQGVERTTYQVSGCSGSGASRTCTIETRRTYAYPPDMCTICTKDTGWLPAGSRIAGNPSNQPQCPASIDASNPAYNIPAGSPKGFDGRCPTARYNHQPRTPQAVGDLWNDYPPENIPQAIDATKDALKGGFDVPAEPAGITGPGSQTGTPTSSSTTGPNGTTTTQKTPTYTYNYGGSTSNQITYQTTYTTVVTTCAGAGSCSTTTTTETPDAPAPQDPEDPCTANPTRVGCTPMGDAPTGEIPKKTEPALTFESEAVSLAVGCPAPYPLGNGHSFDYGPICEVATIVKPAVVGLGLFSAALMCLMAVRRS